MTPDLIARYDQRVPRYTSYPTAPHFTPEVGGDVYGSWLQSLSPGTEASIYLHVPFCAELCLYCGCHTTVVRRYAPIAAYVDMLEREIGLVAERLQGPLKVRHIHWGGGTPTILNASDFRCLSACVSAQIGTPSDAEIAIEIDPRTVSPAQVETLAAVGVNRASLGVQSFEPVVQQAIGRIQSCAETRRVAEWLRHAGIVRINLDLMYGLPYQTVENVVATVERSLDIDPDRIALFGYAHVPWMKRHQKLLPEDALPRSAERFAQSEAAAERICAAGYVRIGLDHFAKPDDPMAQALLSGDLHRNFQGYTTDPTPALIGLGTSAIASLPEGYAQNASTTVEYRKHILEGRLPTARGYALTAEDRLRREVIERLMCDLAVDLDSVCGRHHADTSRFAPELAIVDALAADGLVTRRGTRLTIPDEAWPLVRSVCAVFDTRLRHAPERYGPAV